MDISIPCFREVRDEAGNYFVYTVKVKFFDWEYDLEKRYSEFLELHQVIKLVNKTLGLDLPKFPRKNFLTKILGSSQEHLQERRECLEVYLREISKKECARRCRYFVEFLEMPIRLREAWVRR